MTPNEFMAEIERLRVVCGKCWIDAEADVRSRWVEELRRSYGELAQYTWKRVVDIVIDSHTDAKSLPLPNEFRRALLQHREQTKPNDGVERATNAGRWSAEEHHRWMMVEAATMRPREAKRTLEYIARSRLEFPEEVVAVLKEAASTPQGPRELQTCISGDGCLAAKHGNCVSQPERIRSEASAEKTASIDADLRRIAEIRRAKDASKASHA